MFNSTTGKLVAIYAFPGMSTPEGIHIGSSYTDLHRAYPAWEPLGVSPPQTDGRGLAPAPGNSKAHYRISVRDHQEIQLSLDANDQHCYE